MVIGLTDETNYRAIADAIRAKNKTSETYTPAEMPEAISKIESGSQLSPLDSPASAQEILYGYEAYNSEGNLLSGTLIIPNVLDTVYIISSPVEFVLAVDNWNGSDYKLEIKNYKVGNNGVQIGLPLETSTTNAQDVIRSALTIVYTSSSNSGITLTISAVNTPTRDITISIFGLEAIA